MENEDDNNQFHFNHKNYFLRFKLYEDKQQNSISKSIRHALEYFVDDLKHNREKTIERFLNEPTINDIFRSIAQLLLCDDNCICVHIAYVIGSIVDTERGLKQFLSVFDGSQSSQTVDIIGRLCRLLTHTDFDCVLNATGTLGTICSSKEGRNLILNHDCIAQLVLSVSILLNSTNSWIAGNAALVLARITVDEIGCQVILKHDKCSVILNRILAALDIHDPSRSTNIAFAIARLIEGEDGKKILIDNCGRNQFFEALLKLLEINEDKGTNKNACYALSCLCTSQYGFQLCIQSLTLFHRILFSIEKRLLSNEHETVWFALMCLTTIAKHDEAGEYLCHSKSLLGIIKQIQEKWIETEDIQDESKLLWFMLHKYIKPSQPKIDNCRNTSVDISWDPCMYKENPNEIQYRVILNDTPITITHTTNYSVNNLKPSTCYNVKIQYITAQGESSLSDPIVFQTDDESPPSVINLHAARTTMTAIRIAWKSPDLSACSSFRGYQTYLNDIEYEFTNECGITISSLTANTTYRIGVCVVVKKGRGPCNSISVKTDSAGDSLPAPPTFSVIGRRQLHIKWQAPEVIAGRLSRYELICNGRCIYSGTDQEYHATMLKSNTEYTIVVIVITNEGRFHSRPAKTRTLKDEFHNSLRHSLYEPPTQIQPAIKRADKLCARKISPAIAPNQTDQFPATRSSNNPILPGIVRKSQSRPSRTFYRSKTNLSSQRISAPVIIPTLNVNFPPQINHSTRSKPYRYLIGTKSVERSPSPSLPDLPFGLQRIS